MSGGNWLSLGDMAKVVWVAMAGLPYEAPSSELWWCNSHHRRATHIFVSPNGAGSHHCCDPDLGGIMLPCDCADLTEKVNFAAYREIMEALKEE